MDSMRYTPEQVGAAVLWATDAPLTRADAAELRKVNTLDMNECVNRILAAETQRLQVETAYLREAVQLCADAVGTVGGVDEVKRIAGEALGTGQTKAKPIDHGFPGAAPGCTNCDGVTYETPHRITCYRCGYSERKQQQTKSTQP